MENTNEMNINEVVEGLCTDNNLTVITEDSGNGGNFGKCALIGLAGCGAVAVGFAAYKGTKKVYSLIKNRIAAKKAEQVTNTIDLIYDCDDEEM